MLAKNKNNKNKGQVLVFVALSLVVILGFAALAIDVAYWYHTKNQLQGAADAAALAGAASLDGTNLTNQTDVKDKAYEFALKNIAAGLPVALDKTTDIIIGFWNGTAVVPPTGSQISNAVEVRARRTDEPALGSGMPKVATFFGKIFGINYVSVDAKATAVKPPRASAPIAICEKTCTFGNISTLYWAPYPKELGPEGEKAQGIGWTVFSETSQATPPKELIKFFCGEVFNACPSPELSIYTDNGYKNDVARQFRCAFKNPLYDSENKTCKDGSCNSESDEVTSWRVLVPKLEEKGCPPGDQPKPYKLEGYARIRVTEVYASGGGGTNECACGNLFECCSDPYTKSTMTGSTPNAIKFSTISCVDCNDSAKWLGTKVFLVK